MVVVGEERREGSEFCIPSRLTSMSACKTLLIHSFGFSLGFSRQLDGDSGEVMAETDWDQVQFQVSGGMCSRLYYHHSLASLK